MLLTLCSLRPRVLCLCLFLLFTVGSGPALADSDGVPSALQQLAKDQRVCVAAVATLKNRVVVDHQVATGCSSVQVPSAEPIFQAASLSKPVFAYAVIKLAQQGRISLDASLATYLPQGYTHVQNPFGDSRAPRSDAVSATELQGVTARMVLSHTSGLPNWSGGPLVFDFQPGTRWQYSGEGYVLLQHAVQAITGTPMDVFMREQVFYPLGMNHSDYVWSPRLEADYLPGTSAHGKSLAPGYFRSPVAAFSLYTSALDYARFVAAVLNDAPTLQMMLNAPVSVDPALGLSWGLGWGIESGANGLSLWHWGNNPGYRAFVMASVDSGDGVVILTNGENGLSLAEPLVQAVLPGTHKVFQFSHIPNGLEHWACRTFGMCF